jgi:peptidoglycan-associated lipoprotein
MKVCVRELTVLAVGRQATSYSEETTVMIPSFRTTAVALLIAALAAGACGKKPPVATPAPPPPPPAEKPATTPPPPPPPAPPAPTAPTPDRALTEDEIFAKATPDDLTKMGVVKPAYFSYDSIVLTEEARGVLQKNVEYLKKRASTKVMIEGHADSRGTNEYNLALTSRRAAAVKDYLVSLGVAADRVSTVAKGEEQPFCKDETEACWQQNRVGFFVFTAK